jgi:hypothetical protein
MVPREIAFDEYDTAVADYNRAQSERFKRRAFLSRS